MHSSVHFYKFMLLFLLCLSKFDIKLYLAFDIIYSCLYEIKTIDEIPMALWPPGNNVYESSIAVDISI